MATHLGNTTEMYGHKYNIVVTNVCGKDLLDKDANIVSRSLIISSQSNANKEDIGTYALFASDYEGKVVRLTYTIIPGNGLVQGYDNEEDILRFEIDNDSLYTDYQSGALYVNKGNIIDNSTIQLDTTLGPADSRGKIFVNTRNLASATSSEKGILKADENTTYIDPYYPGEISVRTSKLDTVDDALNRDGIVIHSSEAFRTIAAENGRLQVLTYNLDKATNTSLGIIQGDSDTIFINESGIASVVTENLDPATEYSMGIVKSDNNTILNTEGVLSVQTYNLAHATMESFGIIKPSQWCFDINSYDCLEVKNYADIERLISENWPEHQEMWKDITDLKNRVSKLETTAMAEIIEVFEPAGTLSTVLKYPERDENGNIISYSDKRTVPFKIKSNCKFHAKVDWVNNENPQIKLLYVRYKDEIIVNEEELYNTIFEATGNEVYNIEFTFEICNYNRDNNISGINTNAVISVASINNSAVKQTGHHTFTRWNNYAWIDEEKISIPSEEPVEQVPDDNIVNTREAQRIFIENSETISVDGDSTINNQVLFNTSSSKKFYLTAKVNYTDIDSDGNSTNGTMDLSLSTSANQYPIFIDWKEYEVISGEDVEVPKGKYFNEPKIISTFATTGKNNVLNVSSKNPINTKTRKQRIAIGFSQEAVNAKLINNTNTNAVRRILVPITVSDKLRNLNVNDTIIEKLDVPSSITSSSRVSSTSKVRKISLTSSDLVNSNDKVRDYDIVQDKILKELADACNEVYDKYRINISNPDIKKDRKTKLSEDFENKIADISSKYTKVFTHTESAINANGNSNVSVVVLEYIEVPNIIEKPTLNVVADVLQGAPYIRFTANRSKNSVLEPDNSDWEVKVNYRYINSKGNTIDIGGNNSSIVYSKNIKGNSTTFSATDYLTSGEISQLSSAFAGEKISTGIKNVVQLSITPKYKQNEGTTKNFPMTVSLSPNVSTPSGLYGIFFVLVQGVGAMVENTGIIWQQIPAGTTNGASFTLHASDNDKKHEILLAQLIGLDTALRSPRYDNYWGINNLENLGINWDYTDNRNNYYYVPAEGRTPQKKVDNSTITVTKDIAGIKIDGVEINYGFNTGLLPSITYSVSGGWNTLPQATNSDENNTNKKKYTFGNTKITNITISPWDDTELSISFKLTGGSTTNIPNGTKIKDAGLSKTARTNFIFIVDGNSYTYNDIIYNRYEVTPGEWKNNQCIVKYTLKTDYSTRSTSMASSQRKLFVSVNESYPHLIYAYVEDALRKEERNILNWQVRDLSERVSPILEKVTAIKFWIGLSMDTLNIADSFESSTSSAAQSERYTLSPCTFVSGASKSVSIVNAANNVSR